MSAPDLIDLLGAMEDYFDARRECNKAWNDAQEADNAYSFDYYHADEIDAVARAYKRVQEEWDKVFPYEQVRP